MLRHCHIATLAAALLLPAVGVACPAPAPSPPRHADAEHSIINSRADFDRWMQACPHVLAPLGPLARKRFLDHLEFNENGVTGFPAGELEDALTTGEITVIARRLGLEGVFAGLTAEEAGRLRAQPRPARASAVELKYDRFLRELMRLELEGDDAPLGPALAALHQSLFAAELERRGRLDGHDLARLFRATVATAMHQGDDSLLEMSAALHDELSRRGLETRARSLDMMALLLDAGHLERARALATGNPALPALPPLGTVGGNPTEPAVWDLEAEPGLLVERPIGLAPFHVVARVSLGCAFSRAAMDAIGEDPELGRLFRGHGTWMVSARELAGHARLTEWNRANPATPLSVMAGPARWPMLDPRAGVPAFHVFRDGALVETVTGWPLSEGNREALIGALERAGVEL